MKKLIASLLAATLLTGAASAQVVGSYPYTLTNGSLADANQVMSNFNYLTTQINANTCTLSGCTFTGPVLGTTLNLSSTLGVTGALSGTTAAFSGAITGASYTGGAISGTTGTFSGAVSAASYGAVSATTGTFSGTLGVTGTTTLTGNVGIGAAPSIANLDVSGTNIAIRNSNGPVLNMRTATAAGGGAAIESSFSTGGYGPLTFATSGTTQLSIAASGAATFTNNVSVGGTLGVTGVTTLTNTANINGATSTFRGVNFQTGGTARWGMGADSTAESGGNTGSNFYINQQNDAGFTLGTALAINRASGNVSITNNLSVSGTLGVTGAISGPGTGLTGTAASLSIGGNASTATSATTATNQSGGTLNATSGTVSGALSVGSFSGSALASAAQTLAGSSTTQAITPAGFAGNSSLAVNGYYKMPGGLIIQWGQVASVSSSGTAVSWPITCPSNLFNVQATAVYGGTATPAQVFSTSLSGATLYAGVSSIPVNYMVICN